MGRFLRWCFKSNPSAVAKPQRSICSSDMAVRSISWAFFSASSLASPGFSKQSKISTICGYGDLKPLGATFAENV